MLPVIVLFETAKVAGKPRPRFMIPPPKPALAELPLMVLFATLSVAGPEPRPQQKPSFKMPPPAYFESVAELPVIAQLFTVSVA
ncbi:MAG: hypothetical protein DMC60_02400 [Verrucomicrobia bacterium]|nr:MAG: hypothetical protein DMC60_02400 [Verrucomicrobiota bacterium]